jgi:excisionase family DNA binding protein
MLAIGMHEHNGFNHTSGSGAISPDGAVSLTVTVDEAARQLGISRGLAYEAVRRGELPSVRLGRRILIPRVALSALLAETTRNRPL